MKFTSVRFPTAISLRFVSQKVDHQYGQDVRRGNLQGVAPVDIGADTDRGAFDQHRGSDDGRPRGIGHNPLYGGGELGRAAGESRITPLDLI